MQNHSSTANNDYNITFLFMASLGDIYYSSANDNSDLNKPSNGNINVNGTI